jgi:hypothetical protein
MDDWLILQNFYNELTLITRNHIDVAAGGAFLSLTVYRAKTLIEKMVSNQGWNDEHLQPRQRGMHTVKETDMLATNLDLLLKKLDEHPQDKAPMQALQALDARMTCEVYGNIGHSGNNCPETHEDVMYMNNNNNGFRPQGGQGWNQSRPYDQRGNGNSSSSKRGWPPMTNP